MATKEALAEIRAIVEDIKSGKRKHDQECYHSDCGTAHCIAGWKQVDDLCAVGIEPAYKWDKTEEVWLLSNSPWRKGAWEHAADQWGLSYAESYSLFEPDLTLEQIDSYLKELEEHANS